MRPSALTILALATLVACDTPGSTPFTWTGVGTIADDVSVSTDVSVSVDATGPTTCEPECAAGQTCVDGVCEAPCAPSCGEAVCGDDGCGGSCGACGDGEACLGGACIPGCMPMCGDNTCGADGCGGSCGACLEGETCTDGACAEVCVPACGDAVCGDDGCGGSCGVCGDGLTCDDGACVEPCTPVCSDSFFIYDCGDDGCGGTCGACEDGETCTAGLCLADCVPACDDNTCGADGCGGSCGDCPEDATCPDGITIDSSSWSSEYGHCAAYVPGTQNHDYCDEDVGTGGVLAEDACPVACDNCPGGPCSPSCGDNTCGADGCGGSCGTCPEGESCSDGACVTGCTTVCNDNTCGDDGCGGSCGECPEDATCPDGTTIDSSSWSSWWGDCSTYVEGLENHWYCYQDEGTDDILAVDACPFSCDNCPEVVCEPNCEGKVCGDDGCGGSCGGCASEELCEEGACVACVPDCEGKVCGPNGCSGTCGECPGWDVCADDGQCLPCEPDCAGLICGDDGCGGQCGDCGIDCNAIPEGPFPLVTLDGPLASEDLAFDDVGNVIGSNNKAIFKSPYGEGPQIWVPNFKFRAGLRYLPTGDLVVNNDNTGQLIRIEPDGTQHVVLNNLDYPNGLAVDMTGHVFVTEHDAERVLRVEPYTGAVDVITEGVIVNPNGVTFNADYSTLFVAGFSGVGKIYAFPVTPDGDVGDLSVWAEDVGSGWLDGMAVDICGNLYIADYGTSRILRFPPDGSDYTVIMQGVGNQYLPNMQWGSGIGGWDENKMYIPDGWNQEVFEVDIGVPGKPKPYY